MEQKSMKEKAREMKLAAPYMASVPSEIRNAALKAIAAAIRGKKTEIQQANALDLEAAKENGVPAPVQKRLKFDDAKIADVLSGIDSLLGLPDPLSRELLKRELDDGLVLVRESCPIGVIGVIFEARPDAMVQVSTLCIKSGNCVILKGGSEAKNTNRKLFSVIRDAAVGAGLPENAMLLAETHDDIDQLLDCHESIDLLIPRGSNAFVQHIMNHTKIPVMGHADGICHIYADRSVDVAKAVRIIADAKTQYPAACNAVETLLIHRDAAPALLPALAEEFARRGAVLKGTPEVAAIVPCEPAEESDFATEYLDEIVSAKLVNSLDEAIEHINCYGSHHTDAILTEDAAVAERFMQLVDSAGVYHNCSTRFADGFRYGFGAEVGISTGKLHARGPVGLEGLVTYKYRLSGNGHIVGEYADGTKQFHFKDL